MSFLYRSRLQLDTTFDKTKLQVRLVRSAPAWRVSLLHLPPEHAALVPEPVAPVPLVLVEVVAHHRGHRHDPGPDRPGGQGCPGECSRQANVRRHSLVEVSQAIKAW